MCLEEKRAQFQDLVRELLKCGYLENEIIALAGIGSSKIETIGEEVLDRGIEILINQLEFAKKCIGFF